MVGMSVVFMSLVCRTNESLSANFCSIDNIRALENMHGVKRRRIHNLAWKWNEYNLNPLTKNNWRAGLVAFSPYCRQKER